MRTATEWEAEFNWLTPSEFAKRVGLLTDSGNPSTELVRQMIRDGSSEALQPPLVKDVSRSTRPRYRIHPDAVEKYEAESIRRVEERQAS